MYSADDIATIHLEITSRCNARCPMCARNVHGGRTNPRLPLTELSLEQLRRALPPELLGKLKRIYLCGNYGDPAVAADTLEALAYFRSANPGLRLEMFSNGSVRPEEWWREAASRVDKVFFGIDGLGDVNSVYRRGTSFTTVTRNAAAFIDAGGAAHWDFIVFRHNEHQVEEARALSEKMGFRGFRAKKTGRFFSNQQSAVKPTQEVWDDEGRVLYSLEMPASPLYRNSALARERELAERFGSMERYLDATAIECKVLAEKSLYLSAEGLVFPCCWTAGQLYTWYAKPGSSQVERLLAALPGGRDEINLLKAPLAQVLRSGFYRALAETWDRPSVAAGKPKVCAKVCGQEFDSFREQFR